MANFHLTFEKTLALEGGYKLHDVSGDRGGETYAGISRNAWPDWTGWSLVDAGEVSGPRVEAMVMYFYRQHFWDSIRGDDISYQDIAFLIYDFAVNAGVYTSVSMAQAIVGAVPDGKVGPATLYKIDSHVIEWRSERMFAAEFSLQKIFFYKDRCLHDNRRHDNKISSNLKFLCGWINRVEKGVS